MFDRVTCITLDRRPDRWKTFVDGLPLNWPFKPVEKIIAIDGKKCKHPLWWKQGGGAWGCYRSHLRIIEECLNEGIDSVLLLEDDAVFHENFVDKFNEFTKDLPKDWGMLYLGGQHLFQKKFPPLFVKGTVYRPYNVNRTHAFALRGKTMLEVYKHLNETRLWKNAHHIDHHLGRFLMERKHPIYCPKDWLVGQAEGPSDINCKNMVERFWPSAGSIIDFPAPWVLVVGLHRSGSSLLAGMLHTLGVHMGNKFVGCEPNGGYEAQMFAQMCEQTMPFPNTNTRLDKEVFKKRFKNWALTKINEASKEGKLAGCKYPHSCFLGSWIQEVCGDNLKVVHINRPLEKSIQSLIRREPRRDTKKLESLQSFLWDSKIAFLDQIDHVTVEYEALLENPKEELQKAIDFLEIMPSPSDVEKACSMVEPSRKHF